MKKLIVTALLALSFSASAQEIRHQEVICLPTEKMFSVLQEEHGEQPTSIGNYEKGYVTIWQNVKTGTATIVYTGSDRKESCMVISIINNKPIDRKSGV